MTLSGTEIFDEMDNWELFADALGPDDRALFKEALRLVYEYLPAIQARDTPFVAEALLMSIMFMQHKTIVWLAAEAERLKAEKDARLDT